MGKSTLHPKLRWPLEVNRQVVKDEQQRDQEILLLSCPLGIAKPLPLSAAIAPLLAEFTGTLSLDEICAKYSSYGIQRTLLDELVTILEDSLYLDSPHFSTKEKVFREEYFRLTNRPAALAGLAYPGQPEELKTLVQQYLDTPHSHDALALTKTPPKEKQTLLGIKSPHIDYRRGGRSYGSVFPDLYNNPADIVILIGTSHQYSRGLFHLSKKSFSSPLGTLHTDIPFVDALARNYGKVRSFSEELVHAKEHSLELQLPFIQHKQNTPHIVPILVGGFHSFLHSERLPEEHEVYDAFVATLTEEVKRRLTQGQRVRFVAGVDMAHVGSQFGDTFELTDDFLEKVRERDADYLEHIQHQDKKALFEHIAEDNDARRICGFPTMYTLIDLCDRLSLKYSTILRSYQQAVDRPSGCAVTFAGMSFYAA
jgi:MEMO1 family protein